MNHEELHIREGGPPGATIIVPPEAKNITAFRGIVVIANGERDVSRAAFLSKSLRKVGYSGPVLIISDNNHISFESRWYKTQLARFSPFEYTLFLDADVIAMQPFNELWDLLEQRDLWMARDMHTIIEYGLKDKTSRATDEERLETRSCCNERQPFFNSGVILFRKTEAVLNFFTHWHNEWKRFRTIDQFAAARSMKVTGVFPSQLPPRYNHSLRYYRKEPSSDVTFLHCWGYPAKRYAFLVNPLLEKAANISTL